ncbi:MAG: carboxypeptidase-like regulatory domain-containing protein [Methanopyri archaeon]|jgi:hypothetical protein|nr:carboxypeptidase-like regulatory domain-containing protein [Methanopyri archaeon]
MMRAERALLSSIILILSLAAVAGCTGGSDADDDKTKKVGIGIIAGNVTDSAGEPLPGASVTFSSPTGYNDTMFSNVKGWFQFDVSSKDGPYTGTVTMPDYKTWQKSDIMVEKDEMTILEVVLEPE